MGQVESTPPPPPPPVPIAPSTTDYMIRSTRSGLCLTELCNDIYGTCDPGVWSAPCNPSDEKQMFKQYSMGGTGGFLYHRRRNACLTRDTTLNKVVFGACPTDANVFENNKIQITPKFLSNFGTNNYNSNLRVAQQGTFTNQICVAAQEPTGFISTGFILPVQTTVQFVCPNVPEHDFVVFDMPLVNAHPTVLTEGIPLRTGPMF